MYRLDVKSEFSAAHRLLDYPGACARVHGHNCKVTVTMAAEQLDASGMVVDLLELKKNSDKVVTRFDHHLLNDVPPFDSLNPTSENLAKFLYDEIAARLDVRV